MSYTYAQALNIVGGQLKAITEDKYAAVACNLATTKVWMAKDWRESLATLPPFYLIPGEQDHGPPLPTVPEDFQGLRRAQIQRYTGEVIAELSPTQNLNEVYWPGVPNRISYEAVKRCFRLYPRVPQGFCAPNYFVTGTYKTLPTQITNATLNTALPLKDEYFNVWLESLRYAFYVLSGDPKAGQVTVQQGRRSANGQLARMLMEIEDAAGNEGINDGDHAIHPSEGLVSPRGRYR
jgi:hypothetical protein